MPSNTMADTQLCFVISPIGEEGSPIRERADNLVNYILRPVLNPLGFGVGRADHMAQPGSITSLVIEKVISSDLVVADLTGRNPNVYYELALRHAVQRPYIQLIDSRETSLPFDIKDESTIAFDITNLRSVDQCKDQLRRHVEAVMAPDFRIVTPIGKALQLQATMNEGGATAIILESLEALRKEIAFQKRDIAPMTGHTDVQWDEVRAWSSATNDLKLYYTQGKPPNPQLDRQILEMHGLKATQGNINELERLATRPSGLPVPKFASATDRSDSFCLGDADMSTGKSTHRP